MVTEPMACGSERAQLPADFGHMRGRQETQAKADTTREALSKEARTLNMEQQRNPNHAPGAVDSSQGPGLTAEVAVAAIIAAVSGPCESFH